MNIILHHDIQKSKACDKYFVYDWYLQVEEQMTRWL
jgi:hypothetical protein